MGREERRRVMAIEEEAKKFDLYLMQLGYVKAVRCKDCNHSKTSVSEFGMPVTQCTYFDTAVYSDDWCSHGEAR